MKLWGYLLEVAELWEDIHVSKAVEGDDRAVSWRLLDVQQRMAELVAVCMQEVNGAWQMEREKWIIFMKSWPI